MTDTSKIETLGTPSPRSAGYPRKRARTRRQLVSAGMRVLAESGPDGATIGAIAREAQISTGTFYNHFPSLPDLVAAVTDELTTGVQIGRETLDLIAHDPAVRVLLGTRQLLDLAADDPEAASAFVELLADVPDFRSRVRSIVAGAIEDGIAAGRFPDRDTDAVTDAVLGAVIQWMRSDLAGDRLRSFKGTDSIPARLTVALSIVGVDHGEADALIETVIELSSPTPN